MNNGYTFQSERAIEHLTQIVAYVGENDRTTCKKITAHFGYSFEMMRRYLHELHQTGHIKPNGKVANSVAWSAGCDPDIETKRDSGGTFAHKSSKAYPLNHERSALDCALFGKPAAMREVV